MPEEMNDGEVQAKLKKLAAGIIEEIPPSWGFVLIAFPVGESEGKLCYVSNGSREAVHTLLTKFLRRLRRSMVSIAGPRVMPPPGRDN